MEYLNEIKVTYKRTKLEVLGTWNMGNSSDVEKLFRRIIADEIDFREHFMIIFLNKGYYPIGFTTLSIGGIAGTVVDQKILVGTALKCLASAPVICHNHPSGQLRPSRPDEVLTKDLKEKLSFFEITLIDHIIISSEGMFSFADNGMM